MKSFKTNGCHGFWEGQGRWLASLLALFVAWTAAAAQTNILVWNTDKDQVSADIHSEALFPLLEDIAHQTGWHIFVEPAAAHNASVKFRNLPGGEALQKLLGTLNFALVPETDGPQQLYVFTTTIHAATQRVAAPVAKAPPKHHVANQLMVHIKPGANIDVIARAHGAKVISRNDKLGIYLLEFPDSMTTDTALGEMKSDSEIASVDYNYLFDAPVSPQPAANVPAGAGPAFPTLSPNTSGDPCDPVVGLIDTGIQSSGSQQDPFVLTNINVTGDTPVLSSTTPTHGTAMLQAIKQAIAQQQKSGGSRAAGGSPVRVVAVNVYGSGETASSWNVAQGVQAAVDNGATVLNMSMAGATDGAVLEDIIQQAMARDVLIFAAAGNQPVTTPNYPAAIPGVNAVTALSSPGQLAAYADYGNFVDMALPGTSLVYLNNQPWVVQGTSSATAYASGIAAGAKAANCQPWAQIVAAMQQKFAVPAKSQ